MAEHIAPSAFEAGASHVAIAHNVKYEPPLEFKSSEEAAALAKLAVDLKTATDEVKRHAEKTQTEMKNLGKVTDETKSASDKALVEMNGMSARLTDIEQKLARRPGAGEGPLENKSIGAQFIACDEVKAALAQGVGFKGRVALEVKNITSASATAGQDVSTGLVVADRQPGVVQVLPNRPLMIRDLLMPGRTASNAIEWVRETLFTNNAASVAENPANPKPQSDLTFDLQNTPVRTLAHFVLASRQIMADAPMLQSYIDLRLRYGLAFVEDNQLLNGQGAGTDLSGMMAAASAYAAPAGVQVANETLIDILRLSMLQATLALYPATGHILHPTDWGSIELIKDNQGRYIWANPTGLQGPVMWGLPVCQSLAMAQGAFLTGAFKYACQIFDREDASVMLSTEDRDNFVKNMVTILCEERLALAVYRPQALIKGTFAAAVAAGVAAQVGN